MFSSFQNITRSVLISILCVLFLIGCSSGGNNTSPVVPGDTSTSSEVTANSVSTDINTHYLLTYSLINIDATNPEDVKAEIIPARVGSVHINILKFLEFAPCTDCFKIVGLNFPEPGVLDVNIAITHPFDDLKFTAFDVRGIIMFNGSHVFPESGLTMSDSSMGDGELLNAEGLTRLYNGSTLDMAGDLFTYYQGKLATPTVPNADLNGFIRHITDDPANTRNALYAGDSVTRTYSLDLPSAEFVLGYAVDASWDIPTADPVTDPMTQFSATANCIEPWKIEASCYPIADDGSTTLTIDVYDWQGQDTISTVNVECPELFNGKVAATFVEIIPWFARYEAVISNYNGAPVGLYKVLISAEASENANSPEWTDLSAYKIKEIYVTLPTGSGNLMWAHSIGGVEVSAGYGITTLSDDSIAVSGTFEGEAIFGEGEPNEIILNSLYDTEDIFIARYNPDGALMWAKRAGSEYFDEGRGIIALSDDSIVVTGYFEYSATFGEGEPNQTVLTSAGSADIFIARYNPNGTLAWAKCAGGEYYDEGRGITALSDNSTVVTGSFDVIATFGEGEPNETILGSDDYQTCIFVARFNPDGTLAWAKQAGGEVSDWGMGITALSDNSTVITGHFINSAIFGEGEPNETELIAEMTMYNPDIFIARYNFDGTLAWAKRAGGITFEASHGITGLSDNSTVVTGSFEDIATFGEGEPNETILISDGYEDFVARYNPDGSLGWAKCADGAHNDSGEGITTLSDNSTVVTGYFRGGDALGEIFVARYNPDGSLGWAKYAGGAYDDSGKGITTLSDNSTVVTGYFYKTATFGQGEPNETVLDSFGANDMFIARFMP
jgi:uncharacterized delta-60 repeat protein